MFFLHLLRSVTKHMKNAISSSQSIAIAASVTWKRADWGWVCRTVKIVLAVLYALGPLSILCVAYFDRPDGAKGAIAFDQLLVASTTRRGNIAIPNFLACFVRCVERPRSGRWQSWRRRWCVIFAYRKGHHFDECLTNILYTLTQTQPELLHNERSHVNQAFHD